MNMWLTAGRWLLKNPWVIVIAVMAIGMGAQWININSLKGDIVDLRGDIVKIERNYNTCKSNELTILEASNQCSEQTDGFIANISLLEEQIFAEKDRVVMWRDKYNNKVCYNPVEDTVTVKPDEVRVLNDEKNIDAVNRINDIFGN